MPEPYLLKEHKVIALGSKEYRALTPTQRAKVRKAWAEYEAERNPIRNAALNRDTEARREAYTDLDCENRRKESRAYYDPRIKSIQENISALNAQLQELQRERNDKDTDICAEPYRVAYADPKRQALYEVWESIDKKHEAKMNDLLASFQNVEVA